MLPAKNSVAQGFPSAGQVLYNESKGGHLFSIEKVNVIMKSEPIFTLWPIVPFGSDENDGSNSGDNGSKGNSGQQSNNQGNQGNSQSDNKSGQKSQDADDDDADDEYKDYTPKELRRLAKDLNKKAKDAEIERDSFKTKVDEEDRKKRTVEENLKTDLDNANARISTLESVNAKLAITNAILNETKYSWNDVEIVAAQLNSQIVKVNEDGSVEGIKKELDRVAKDQSFLLKSRNQGQQQNSGQQQGTGFQPGQGGANNGGSGNPDPKELAKNYPALAGRIGL